MKHFKLIFCVVASMCIASMSAYVHAQSNSESQYEALSPENQFFHDGMKWNYDLDNRYYHARATVIGDSILKISNASAENSGDKNEIACKALKVEDVYHPQNAPELYAVRECQNRIEVWNSDKEQFVCIMDFGIEEGEDINGMTVTKIDHVKVGPELRRRITLTENENGSVRRWIYGIGADEFTSVFYNGDDSRVYKLYFFGDDDNSWYFDEDIFDSSSVEAENKFYCDGKQWEVITEWPNMDMEPQTHTVAVGEEAEIEGVRCRKIGNQYVCDLERRTYLWIEELKRWVLEMDFNLNECTRNPKYGMPIRKVDHILVNGQPRKRIAFEGNGGQNTYWVEGIGASDDNFIYNFMIEKPTDGSRHRMLSCSQDNEVIFTYPEFASTASIPRTYVPTVREDRVWCYQGHWGPMIDYELHYIHFDGTAEVGGKTYHKGVLFKSAKYDYVGNDTFVFMNETERDVIMYYLREEDGKVYQLQHLDNSRYPDRVGGPLPENLNPDDYCEGILYDWTLMEGDVFVPEIDGGGGYDGDMVVEYGDEITIDGEECRVMGFSSFYPFVVNEYPFIEGIGCTYNGTVGHYYFVMLAGGGYYSEPDIDSYLKCVYNGEGKLIYGEEVKLADGVNDIITDKADDADAPVYDLMGRRVTNPLPGSVYIRDGRKFIGR